MERYFPLELYGETYYVFVGSGSFYADDSSGGEPVAMIFRSNMSSDWTAPIPISVIRGAVETLSGQCSYSCAGCPGDLQRI